MHFPILTKKPGKAFVTINNQNAGLLALPVNELQVRAAAALKQS
jgi:hypothetical protein